METCYSFLTSSKLIPCLLSSCDNTVNFSFCLDFQTWQCFQSWWGALWCFAWLSALPCLDLVRKKGVEEGISIAFINAHSVFFFFAPEKRSQVGLSQRDYMFRKEKTCQPEGTSWQISVQFACAAVVSWASSSHVAESLINIHSSYFLWCFRTCSLRCAQLCHNFFWFGLLTILIYLWNTTCQGRFFSEQ